MPISSVAPGTSVCFKQDRLALPTHIINYEEVLAAVAAADPRPARLVLSSPTVPVRHRGGDDASCLWIETGVIANAATSEAMLQTCAVHIFDGTGGELPSPEILYLGYKKVEARRGQGHQQFPCALAPGEHVGVRVQFRPTTFSIARIEVRIRCEPPVEEHGEWFPVDIPLPSGGLTDQAQ
jgi:hypothetical protein